jgi:hypothetical protein
MILGGVIGSPFLLYFGFFEYMTAPVYYYSASLMAAGGATATGLTGAAILGVGALVTYAAMGLGYLYFAAKDAYSNVSIKDIFQSRLMDTSAPSFKGVLSSIGAVLWSPFLLVGALAGMGIRTAVDAYKKRSSTPASSNDSDYGTDNLSKQQGQAKAPQNHPPLFHKHSHCCGGKTHNNTLEQENVNEYEHGKNQP